jgi:hypothetical protein
MQQLLAVCPLATENLFTAQCVTISTQYGEAVDTEKRVAEAKKQAKASKHASKVAAAARRVQEEQAAAQNAARAMQEERARKGLARPTTSKFGGSGAMRRDRELTEVEHQKARAAAEHSKPTNDEMHVNIIR